MNSFSQLSKRIGELESTTPSKTHVSVMERIAKYEKFFTLLDSPEYNELSEQEQMEKLQREGYDSDFLNKMVDYMQWLEGV